jgi:cobalt/nickel transport system permease protein
MINFTIPGTGSSGHVGGGLILTALLGPYSAFLAMISILTVQALFFADGGMLALGCNVLNMAFFSCFIAYPLLFQPIVGKSPNRVRLTLASVIAAVVGLQLGAFGVVLETTLSGISALPIGVFILFMQPIHLAIGVVEGLATAAVLLFVYHARPDALHMSSEKKKFSGKLAIGFLVAALTIGTMLSWFASQRPDGLEWSMEKTSGSTELETRNTGLHSLSTSIRKAIAFLPDYAFPAAEEAASDKAAPEQEDSWPAVDSGTSLAGVVGASFTLLIAGFIGFALKRRLSKKS